MKRFIEGADRGQSTLLPECLDDFIDESNPVRAVDAFVDALNLGRLGFDGVDPAATGRPSYHPSALLKLYIYGYLNRIQSSFGLCNLLELSGMDIEIVTPTSRCTEPGVSPRNHECRERISAELCERFLTDLRFSHHGRQSQR
jgi:Transposase domain (DUF772)